MVLTVAAVLHIIQIVTSLLAEQSKALGAGDVELLLAIRFVALHTGANIGTIWFANFLANIAS